MRKVQSVRWFNWVLAVVMCTACIMAPERLPSYVLELVVLDSADSAPVAGATLDIELRYDSAQPCGGQSIWRGMAFTNAQGIAEIYDKMITSDQCLTVTITRQFSTRTDTARVIFRTEDVVLVDRSRGRLMAVVGAVSN